MNRIRATLARLRDRITGRTEAELTRQIHELALMVDSCTARELELAKGLRSLSRKHDELLRLLMEDAKTKRKRR